MINGSDLLFSFPIGDLLLWKDYADVSAVQELQHALEGVLLPVVLGLTTTKESRLESSVQFSWKTLDDDQANLLLLPKNSQGGGERKVSEDGKKDAVGSLLSASGCLHYSVHGILVQIPAQVKKSFPSYLHEGMLEAISIQALAQPCTTTLVSCSTRAASRQTMSVQSAASLQLMTYFRELKGLVECLLGRSCHKGRVPPPWGVMKNMHKEIPDVACKKFQVYRQGTSCRALIHSGRMLMASLRFRVPRSIRTMTKMK
ncbi:Endosomal targeting BRO1-like domain-containing protein [Zea mays]|uniref:Endosomal targeting BRO1-like domain-containing protein n=1 Tax=Zea mays TaxID=4577 RepID=A0A1D6F5N4_MAIZE|nr:Endosomal targeting BRO1-like domain-containing protein [Zea mays]